MKEKQPATEVDSPVYAFLEKPSMIDYPGHLCGVFFLSGCNFACGFCHNAPLMGRKQHSLAWSRLDEICRRFKADWVDAVCITGGEPTLDAGLEELIAFYRNYGFRIKLDSNGARPEVLRRCIPLVDYIAMDIKADLAGYPELTGFSDTGKIAESVRLIMESDRDYEFRTTIIEPFHTDERIKEIAGLIRGAKRYCIQPFIPQENLPDPRLRQYRRTPPARLREIETLLKPFVQELIVRGA